MIGKSFAPLAGGETEDERRRRMRGGPGGGNLQQSIQTLGLRIPRVVGAHSPIPLALLTSPGSAGAIGGGNPLLEAILRSILPGGGGTAPGLPGVGGPPPPPLGPPNITPGDDPNAPRGGGITAPAPAPPYRPNPEPTPGPGRGNRRDRQ